MYRMIIFTIVILMILMSFATPAQAQEMDKWNLVYKTPGITDDSLFITDGGAQNTPASLRIKLKSMQVNDTIVYGRRVPLVSFSQRHVDMWWRSFPGCQLQFTIRLHHGDTAVTNDQTSAAFGNTSWNNAPFNLWVGDMAEFDSVSLVLFSQFTPVSNFQTVDIDQFQTLSQVFYSGGDVGTISGMVFFDGNQNTLLDPEETILSNWKVYVMDESTDSTLTDENGCYELLLPYGNYVLSPETRQGWQQTVPESSAVTLAINARQLNAYVLIGQYTIPEFTYRLNKNWNIVSLPRQVLDPRVTAVFSSATSRAYGFTTDGYQPSDSLESGKGYWLKMPYAQYIGVEGDPIMDDTINVNEGWNLVGSVTFRIAASSITSEPSGLVTSPFFGYNGRYEVSDTLNPGYGYWVKVNAPGKLILSSHLTVTASRIRIMSGNETPPPPPAEATEQITSMVLEQNFPNPFNPATTLTYQLAEPAHVTLRIFSVLGQELSVLVDQPQDRGVYSLVWAAGNLPSGVYFYQLQAGGTVSEVRRMTLLK